MPTASAAHKTGWRPWSAAEQCSTIKSRTTVRLGADRRPAPGIAASSSSSRPAARHEVWRQLSWEEHLQLLSDYCKREGHARVPLEYEEAGPVRLGTWLSRQWTEHYGGRLSVARTRRLAEAGVVWGGPPPPAAGLIDARHLNERKWDTGRGGELAAAAWKQREFDSTKPAAEGDHWRVYQVETDPHLRPWRERQRARGVTVELPKPAAPYIPYGHPPVKGLNMALATRLNAAKKELQSENENRARPAPGHRPPPGGRTASNAA
jgi:hypothetical protein